MGLDMYLQRTRKVEGYTAENYYTVDNAVWRYMMDNPPTRALDLEAISGLPKANELLSCVKNRGKEDYPWYGVLEDVGYWRKANQIHNWFVANVQSGVDECQPHLVTQEHLKELLSTVKKVQQRSDRAKVLLPTVGGFFFGSTDYDEGYRQDLDHTVQVVEKVLAETDFDNQVVIYCSSW